MKFIIRFIKIFFIFLLFANKYSYAQIPILDSVRQISVNATHNCSITTNNDLYCWGDNRYGQLGNGTFIYSKIPIKIMQNVNYVSTIYGEPFINNDAPRTCAITTNGKLYCWGRNHKGQIGNGDEINQVYPVEILSDVASVSLGASHTCAVKTNGMLYCWGSNERGQLGDGTQERSLTPKLILKGITNVTLSADYSCAIKNDHKLYCWGDNFFMQASPNVDSEIITTPSLISDDVLHVTLGIGSSDRRSDGMTPYGAQTCFITLNNDLYCFGDFFNELKFVAPNIRKVLLGNLDICTISLDDELNCYSEFGHTGYGVLIDVNMQDVYDASVNWFYICIVKNSGELYCYGGNKYGQLGIGYECINVDSNNEEDEEYGLCEKMSIREPQLILQDVKKVSLNSTNACALKSTGALYCFGNNDNWQVGNGNSVKEIVVPQKILENASNVKLTSITNGFNDELPNTCVIKEDKGLYCFGSNDYGQVGNGTTSMQATPVLVLENVRLVKQGIYNTCALTYDADLYCFGNNDYGQIGNGTTQNEPTPYKVLENVRNFSIGGSYEFNTHVCAVTNDDTLYCWGDNQHGQIGNDSFTVQVTPYEILTNVRSVSLGEMHSCAIKKDNSLWCWGYNEFGQVGDASFDDASTPREVLQDVSTVSLGDGITCAIKITGEAYCFGEYSASGSFVYQNTPIEIMQNVSSVSLKFLHGCLVTTNATLYCWGYNSNGQVGNGTTEDQASLQEIMQGVVSVSVGIAHTCAVKFDGSLYCWGYNNYGQIGNITPTWSIPITSPYKIIDGVESVNVSYVHTCAIKTDKSLYCWGDNHFGLLNGQTSYLPNEVYDGSAEAPEFYNDCTLHWNAEKINHPCENEMGNMCYETATIQCFTNNDVPSVVCSAGANCCEDALYSLIGNDCYKGIGACVGTGKYYCSGESEDSAVLCNAKEGTPSIEKCNDIDDDCDSLIDEDFNVGTKCETSEGIGEIVCKNENESYCKINIPFTPTPTPTPPIEPTIDVVTPYTNLPKPILLQNKKMLVVRLPKINKASFNKDKSNPTASFKYITRLEKTNRNGNKDVNYKLNVRIFKTHKKNAIRFKKMDLGTYAVKYRVLIKKKKKEKRTRMSQRVTIRIKK